MKTINIGDRVKVQGHYSATPLYGYVSSPRIGFECGYGYLIKLDERIPVPALRQHGFVDASMGHLSFYESGITKINKYEDFKVGDVFKMKTGDFHIKILKDYKGDYVLAGLNGLVWRGKRTLAQAG